MEKKRKEKNAEKKRKKGKRKRRRETRRKNKKIRINRQNEWRGGPNKFLLRIGDRGGGAFRVLECESAHGGRSVEAELR